MSDLPSIPYATAWSTQCVDNGHLKTLAICHYVLGGITMLFSSIFIIHIVMGVLVVSGKLPMGGGANGPAMPTQVGYLFVIMGSVAVFLGWSFGILMILSGRAMARRRWWMFSLVIAGLSCTSFPFGTLLGIFTFVVLLRPSVRAQYPLVRL